MLRMTRTRYTYSASSALKLRGHAGSVWRGAFGAALRELACITGAPTCAGCPLLRQCAYPEIFETPAPQDGSMLSSYRQAPHPYVIRALDESRSEPAARVEVDVTLIGRAVRHAALVMQAMRRAGARLVRQSPLELAGVNLIRSAQLDLATDERAPQALRLVLETPLRLRVSDAYLGAGQFQFGSFFTTLMRRISQLCEVHAEHFPEPDYRELAEWAKAQTLRAANLRWQDAHRYSSRQGREVPLGGLVGSFEIEGGRIPAFWPWLRIGESVHVGKATVMGLGAYRLEPLQ